MFRRQIEIMGIDPSAPYASGIRAALPGVKIAVDKWHLVALAHTMVTEVRQRVTRNLLGRRGTVADPIWVNRHLLLTGAEHLSSKQQNRLWRSFDTCDPTKEVQAAWAVKERLRLLLREREPSKIRWRLADFYEAALDAHLPEATRLASTVQTWWPAIFTALINDVDNARTEGFNRIIKQVKRTGCGHRNMINYQRRILTLDGRERGSGRGDQRRWAELGGGRARPGQSVPPRLLGIAGQGRVGQQTDGDLRV
jgi:transposase